MSRVDIEGQSVLIPGTLSYLSPERRFRNQAPSLQADMWALGCIGYEICIGQQLSVGNNRQPIDYYMIGGVLSLTQVDQRYHPHVRFIIEQCLQIDPSARCTASQLRDHITRLLAQ